jgi:hypothetical protein
MGSVYTSKKGKYAIHKQDVPRWQRAYHHVSHHVHQHAPSTLSDYLPRLQYLALVQHDHEQVSRLGYELCQVWPEEAATRMVRKTWHKRAAMGSVYTSKKEKCAIHKQDVPRGQRADCL